MMSPALSYIHNLNISNTLAYYHAMLFILAFICTFSFCLSAINDRELCKDDCSGFICGDKICSLCTSEREKFDLVQDIQKLNPDHFHLVYHYIKPEGVCYNELDTSLKKDCIEDDDCDTWQICIMDYPRTPEGIDWSTKHSYCVAASAAIKAAGNEEKKNRPQRKGHESFFSSSCSALKA